METRDVQTGYIFFLFFGLFYLKVVVGAAAFH